MTKLTKVQNTHILNISLNVRLSQLEQMLASKNESSFTKLHVYQIIQELYLGNKLDRENHRGKKKTQL